MKAKYTGKVVQGKGICFKVTKIQIIESRICNVSGNVDFEVKLACLLFSSFKNEVLEGEIKSASKSGIVVDFLGIEIFIPELNLFRNTKLYAASNPLIFKRRGERHLGLELQRVRVLLRHLDEDSIPNGQHQLQQ